MSAVLNTPELIARPMAKEDLSQVLEIEQSVYNFPWSIGIMQDCLKMNYECVVVETNANVIAYVIVSAATDEAHILNLCVAKEYQGQGVGKFLLEHIYGLLSLNKICTIFLEVRPSNFAAVALYLGSGFHQVGERKDYYPAEHGREDALVMAKTLIDEKNNNEFKF